MGAPLACHAFLLALLHNTGLWLASPHGTGFGGARFGAGTVGHQDDAGVRRSAEMSASWLLSVSQLGRRAFNDLLLTWN